MTVARRDATAAQIKAASNSLRLRIVRLCSEREWTNQQLAVRLQRDPATILHHLRVLVDAELIEPVGVRQGVSGAYEKPYRSTGLSWQLSFGDAAHVADTEDTSGMPPMLIAFRDELAEAGPDSIADLSRFHLHLDEEELAVFLSRFQNLVDGYVASDPERRARGAPDHGGMFALHRLAEPTDHDDSDAGASDAD